MGRTNVLAIAMLAAAVLSIAMLAPLLTADDKESSPSVMQKKLNYSTKILQGITVEDFELIEQSAAALNKLAEQRWGEEDSPEYRTQYHLFWFINEELLRGAKEKNIDTATLAYVQLTQTCVNCHKLLRKE